MAIFIIYFSVLNVWASILPRGMDSGAFILFILLPSLPSITIAIWYIVTRRSAASFCNRTQQLLRGSAGPDELLVRELENANHTDAKQDNSG